MGGRRPRAFLAFQMRRVAFMRAEKCRFLFCRQLVREDDMNCANIPLNFDTVCVIAHGLWCAWVSQTEHSNRSGKSQITICSPEHTGVGL